MKPAAHVRSNVSNDGLILLDIATGQIFSANLVGARIWSGLERGLTVPEIVQVLVAETGADAATIERDTSDFLNTLKLRALIGEF